MLEDKPIIRNYAPSFGLGYWGWIVFWLSLGVLVLAFIVDPTTIVIADDVKWAFTSDLVNMVGVDSLHFYAAIIWAIKLAFTGIWAGPLMMGVAHVADTLAVMNRKLPAED